MKVRRRLSVKLILLIVVMLFILIILTNYWGQYRDFYKNVFSNIFSLLYQERRFNFYESMMLAEKAKVNGNNEVLIVYAFKGMLPGAKLSIDKGDQVVIHFYNQLDEAADIHWHGIEQGDDSDGLLLTELLIAPNGYYRYEFIAPRSGTFWYHPNFGPTEKVFTDASGAFIIKKNRNKSLYKPDDESIIPIQMPSSVSDKSQQYNPIEYMESRNDPMFHCPGLLKEYFFHSEEADDVINKVTPHPYIGSQTEL